MTLLENHYVPTGQLELIADFLDTYEEAITVQDRITMTQMIAPLTTPEEPPQSKCHRQRQS